MAVLAREPVNSPFNSSMQPRIGGCLVTSSDAWKLMKQISAGLEYMDVATLQKSRSRGVELLLQMFSSVSARNVQIRSCAESGNFSSTASSPECRAVLSPASTVSTSSQKSTPTTFPGLSILPPPFIVSQPKSRCSGAESGKTSTSSSTNTPMLTPMSSPVLSAQQENESPHPLSVRISPFLSYPAPHKKPLQYYEQPAGCIITPSPSPPPLQNQRRAAERPRRHECKVCLQRFFRSNDLKRHMYVHGEPRPFVCPRCKKGFSRRDALERHKAAVVTGKRIQCTPQEKPPHLLETKKTRVMSSVNSEASIKVTRVPAKSNASTNDQPQLLVQEGAFRANTSESSNSLSESGQYMTPTISSNAVRPTRRLESFKKDSTASPLFTLAFVAAMSAPMDS